MKSKIENEKSKMLMAVLLIIISLVTIGGRASVYGDQSEAREIVDIMISSGFENVRAFTLSDSMVVEYENRIYFKEKDAIRIVIPEIMNAAHNIQTLILVSKKDNVPLLQITVSRDDYLKSMGNRDITDKIETSQKDITTDHNFAGGEHNSSIGKIDVILYPEFRSLLGRFNDPFIYRFAISPEFSTFLGKGIRSSVQVRFLLHDEIENKAKRVALARLCFDYTYRSPTAIFINLGGGYFGDRRYGLASEVLLFGWGNRLGVGGTAARLGNVFYQENTLYYTKMWKWTALANLQYRLPFWNVLLTTQFGRFLYQDHGVLAEITRFFRNTCMTVFAAKTDHGSIGGFKVQILTYPRRHLTPHRVRVRLPTVLKMQYRYSESDDGVTFSPRSKYDMDYAAESFWLMNLE